MTTITRIRTEFDSRLHIEMDSDAAVVDCFYVMLPPYATEPGVLVYRAGADINELWADALATVARLRAQPWKAIHPPHIFQPFGSIVARNYIDVSRETELRIQKLNAQHHPDQMQRVQSLGRAWDLLDGAPLPTVVPWPSRELH